MSTAGGLQRRRGAASSSSPTTENGNGNGSTSEHTRQNQSEWAGSGHAGSAFAGGSKIAYDPRDLIDEEKQPRLTLMEEVMLLGLKDKQGYLSFWNDNISYALRGCIIIELAIRRRIALYRPTGSLPTQYGARLPLADRIVTVINSSLTGETILDETLRMMKSQEDIERLGVNAWIDLLSGETWNVMKIGFQLKQVRERLAKGLVDKGVLRTEKRNFLLFDMATHPVADVRTKEALIRRVVSLLTSTTSSVPPQAKDGLEGTRDAVLRSVCLVCTAYTASVLDNALGRMGYEERESAFQRADEILAEFSVWPYGAESGIGANTPGRRKASRIAMGSRDDGRESIVGLVGEVRREAGSEGSGSESSSEDTTYEIVAAVLDVLAKLDSLI